MKFGSHLDSSAAEVPVKFHSDTKLPITRLRDFTRSYDKTSYRILKRGPGIRTSYVENIANDQYRYVDKIPKERIDTALLYRMAEIKTG